MLRMSSILSRLLLRKVFLPVHNSGSLGPIRNYAARKGTRARKEKKKVKKVVEAKVGFVPHNQRQKDRLLASRIQLKFDDSKKGLPVDDVYKLKYYRWKIYAFEEAVQCHRETHHPSMYNVPNGHLRVRIELNMHGEKKTRLVDDFSRICAIPHKFEHGEERSIVAFAKTVDGQREALSAGVQLAGGVDLIKQIQSGAVLLQNFDYIIAHPDILPELVSLRGLMKRKFPNTKTGTLDVDLATVATRFMTGINYQARKDEVEKDFGLVETVIGSLDMETRCLEGNFRALVRDIWTMKPRRDGDFISRCLLISPPSQEKFKVDYASYVDVKDDKDKKGVVVEAEEEEEVGERVTLP